MLRLFHKINGGAFSTACMGFPCINAYPFRMMRLEPLQKGGGEEMGNLAKIDLGESKIWAFLFYLSVLR
jgi:hypothetical protein